MGLAFASPIFHSLAIQLMGQSIRWYPEEQNEENAFPVLDWNLLFDDDSYLNCFSDD